MDYENRNQDFTDALSGQPQPSALPAQEEPVTFGEWIVTFLLLMIPCVNLILALIWAFSKTEKKSKSNFFKAYLLLMVIVAFLSLIAVIAAAMMIPAILNSYSYY